MQISTQYLRSFCSFVASTLALEFVLIVVSLALRFGHRRLSRRALCLCAAVYESPRSFPSVFAVHQLIFLCFLLGKRCVTFSRQTILSVHSVVTATQIPRRQQRPWQPHSQAPFSDITAALTFDLSLWSLWTIVSVRLCVTGNVNQTAARKDHLCSSSAHLRPSSFA